MLDDELRRRVRAALSRIPALASAQQCRTFAAPILEDALLANLEGESADARARCLWKLTALDPQMQARLLEEAAEAAISPEDQALLANAAAAVRTPSSSDPKTREALDRYRAERIAAWAGAPFELDARFVRLTLSLPLEASQRPREYGGLDEVLKDISGNGLLVDGAPGAGKSTLLRRLELEYAKADLASGHGRRVVFHAALHDYLGDGAASPSGSGAPGSDAGGAHGRLRAWLEARFSAMAPELPPLSTLLSEGRVVLLLDGINEMSLGATGLDRFRAFGALIRDLPPGNQAVITSRSLDVQGLSELPRATVLPLDRARIQELLALRVGDARAEEAMRTMERDRTLELYGNPYLLSLLAGQLGEGGELPRDRAALFSRFVVRAILRELDEVNGERWRSGDLLSAHDRTCLRAGTLPAPDGSDRGGLLEGLGRLAFHMQSHGKGEWRREPLTTARARLADDPSAADVCLAAGVDLGVLDYDVKGARVQFRHQLLQEFFAARAWLEQHARLESGDSPAKDALMAVANRPHRAGDPALGRPLEELMKSLPPGAVLDERPVSGWEEVAIMAAAMAPDDRFVLDLLEVDPVQAARAGLGEGGRVLDSTAEVLRARAAAWMTDSSIELRARIDAGLALDRPDVLGFERGVFEETRGGAAVRHEYLLPPRVRVPAGTYRIGSAPDDPQAWDDEKPIRKIEIESAFELATYPVTNAEYACFMAAGGYDDERWWPKGSEAAAWRSGTREDTERADEVRAVQGWSDAEFEDVAAHGGWPEEAREALRRLRKVPFEEALAEVRPTVHPGMLGRPAFWSVAPYDRPLQPVVGVSAFEAEAYARWLTCVARRDVALPTEFEWEAAARAVRWPRWSWLSARRHWAHAGEDSPLRANTREGHVRRPTPVGAYPEGRTPEGLEDLSGNVWEWTSSAWTSSHAADAETNPTRRVVRGGSWFDSARLARCACRLVPPPDRRLVSSGFRLRFVPDPDL